jgi:hypothetical protein
MDRDQQKQLVIAFVEAYNLATGSSFRVESWPEDEHRNIPAVEVIASDHDRGNHTPENRTVLTLTNKWLGESMLNGHRSIDNRITVRESQSILNPRSLALQRFAKAAIVFAPSPT